ncbi:MAG: tetratricopeptide repeat protein [Chthoniobacterales bacterium]
MRRVLPFLLAGTVSVAAQDPTEVRRAEPVSAVAVEPEVRRAEPAAPGPPVAIPVRPAVRNAPTDPAAPAAVPATAPGDGLEEFRAAPSTGVLDGPSQIFTQANALYAKKMYDLAVAKYREFLQTGRVGPDREATLFRLGESYRSLGRSAEAAACYRQLLAENKIGDFLGPAAYRLGEIQYAARDFSGAADSFRVSAQQVRDSKLRLASRFFEGRSLDGAGRKSEALSAYREVAAQKEDNPYRDRAVFDLAEADARAGLNDSAYRQFRALADTAQNPSVRMAAAVKAGLLAIDNKEFDKARPLLDAAAANQEVAAWNAAARAGLVRLDYESENYEGAAKRAADILPNLPPESRPEVLLLAANARRQLGQQAEALALYDQLAAEFPDSPSAREAGFHRLVSLVAQKDARAMDQIDSFLASAPDNAERSKAALLKAELLFAQNQFAEAAKLYEQASSASGADKYRADALYKLAWCRLQEKKYDQAVQVLTRFLLQYPRHPMVASAYAQRAMANMQTGDQTSALADFEAIIERNRAAKEREVAMVQRALLLGNLQRSAEMVAAFERLLAEYPETKSAAQANYWIGYVALENKKYKDAIAPLEKARAGEAKDYGEKATLRLLLSYYYLQDRASALREARALGADKTPAEVRNWLGLASLEAGDYADASEFLGPLAAADDASDDVRLALARAQIGAGNMAAAKTTLEKLLPRVHEPKAKAQVHLLLADALIGLKQGDKAKLQAEEALRLQPEGRINAEARLANGRALLAQDRFDDAARAFMAVALLYDDKDLSPQALVLAEKAYRQANNTTDADRAREELQRRYPDFKVPASS